MQRNKIIIGETYGYIKVLSLADRPYRAYNCRCLKCCRDIVLDGYSVHRSAETGCSECKRAESAKSKALEYIGHRFGHLLVKEYVGLKARKDDTRIYRYSVVVCECDCGNVAEYPLSRLLAGQAKTCDKCSKKNLDLGRQLIKETAAGGTSPITLSPKRKVNKNSTTGARGVSYETRRGKYRAYINFKRKQYYLGSYDKIEDAIEARKIAEKKIYGDFLRWYQEEYPEQWEKIKDKIH